VRYAYGTKLAIYKQTFLKFFLEFTYVLLKSVIRMILPECFNIAIRVAWHISHKQQDFE